MLAMTVSAAVFNGCSWHQLNRVVREKRDRTCLLLLSSSFN